MYWTGDPSSDPGTATFVDQSGKMCSLMAPSLGNKAFAIGQTMLSCTTPPTQKPRNFNDEVYAVKMQLHEIWLAGQPAEEEDEEHTNKRKRTARAGR